MKHYDFQTILNVLTEAINTRKTVSILYAKDPAEQTYPRLVEPYALYKHATTSNINLDAFQWYGDAKASEKRWKFKSFNLAYVKTIRLINPIKRLGDNPKYNPGSERYVNAIAKR